ncbi:hypothetical protein [Paraburkholderia sp. GAS348]|uniref:hypothetical protein n=1 Tax=Paraburkholderia sp. GAS348 TaxID=3035132 RepID=UPI003D26225B
MLQTVKQPERIGKLSNTNSVLGQVVEIMAANTRKMGVLGARAMVMGTFHDAVLPHLTTLQRVSITRSFPQGIEDILSLMDDVALPAKYHSTLLELTNSVLAELRQESVRSR